MFHSVAFSGNRSTCIIAIAEKKKGKEKKEKENGIGHSIDNIAAIILRTAISLESATKNEGWKYLMFNYQQMPQLKIW